MKIVRKRLSADELQNPNLRYNEDCDCVQQTVDGTNWVDSPGADPRSADVFQRPARAGADPRCDAAANMTALLRASIDSFLTATSIAFAVSTLLDLWLLALPGVGVLIDLIVILCEGLFSIGTAAIALTFTNAVYEQLFCIFYCNISDDGTVTSAQLSAILDDIHALGDGVIDAVMDYILNTWGPVGLSNAGAGGAEVGDCSACGCAAWCVEYNFVVSDGGWTALIPRYTFYDNGAAWRSTGADGAVFVAIEKALASDTVLTEVEVRGYTTRNSDGTTDRGWTPDPTDGTITIPIPGWNAAVGGYSVTWTGTQPAATVLIGAGIGVSSQNIDIDRVILRGTGTKPGGGVDC